MNVEKALNLSAWQLYIPTEEACNILKSLSIGDLYVTKGYWAQKNIDPFLDENSKPVDLGLVRASILELIRYYINKKELQNLKLKIKENLSLFNSEDIKILRQKSLVD